MTEKFTSKVEITTNNVAKTAITLDGEHGFITLNTGKATNFELWGTSQFVPGAQIYSGGFLALGGTPDGDGELRLYAKGARKSAMDITNFRVHLSGDNGMLTLLDSGGSKTIRATSEDAKLAVGVGPAGARAGKDGTLVVVDKKGTETIHLNGSTGDILLANADCAEEFDVVTADLAEPGTVMVLTDDGRLQQGTEAYDRRVAGVVSGAGAYKPGIVLDRRPLGPTPRAALAMVGKVYCKVDASFGAIRVGDLLTSSPTPGHAMRASDPQRAFGAVIGKALQPFAEGQGLVAILVALQ